MDAAKTDIQISESDEEATSKSKANSAVNENNVEKDIGQKGKHAKQNDLSQEVNNVT